MGISSVYIKFVAEYTARREYKKANQLLSTGLCATVPFCLLVFACFYLLWPSMVIWLKIVPALQTDAREVVLSVVAIFLASLSLGAFHDAVVGAQKTDQVQKRWVVCYVIETILIFWLSGDRAAVFVDCRKPFSVARQWMSRCVSSWPCGFCPGCESPPVW